VWRVTTKDGELLYVGRTGDSSSPHASAPFKRLGQHLSQNDKQNPLRRHLEARGISPEICEDFEFIAHGPVFEALTHAEDDDLETRKQRHYPVRDQIAALEKALADALSEVGYDVLNTVRSRKPLDQSVWSSLRTAFAEHFPELRALTDQ
tara:strand:+ start:1544 stop:1993 length:450 start_codon:yes stop_codon:yes gene_type:complete